MPDRLTAAHPTSALPDPLDAALQHARAGLPVLPLHGLDAAGHCTCAQGAACAHPGKHPVLRDWPSRATTDERTIRAWWRVTPEANVGIATGAASGIVVLDVDPDKGGAAALAALEAEHGPLPRTPRALTGGGGWHLLFAAPPGGLGCPTAVGGNPGLDLRGDRGLIVAPGSRHASGGVYRWAPALDIASLVPAPMPDWLRRLGEPRAARAAARTATQRERRAVRSDDMQARIDAVMGDADIIAVAGELGLAVNGEGKLLCPFHAERTPSCQLYPGSNRYYCWGGCPPETRQGSVLDLYMRVRGVGFREALDALAERCGIGRRATQRFLFRTLPVAGRGVDVDTARELFRAHLRAWIARGRGRVLLVTLPPGVGKTTVAAEVVRELQESGELGLVVWHMPNHDAYRDPALAALRDAGAVEVQPREEGTCEQAASAKALGGLGYNVAATLCRRCAARERCGYYAQYTRGGARVRCLQHEHLHVSYSVEGAKLVVVDESPLECCAASVPLDGGELDALTGHAGGAAERALLQELRLCLADLARGAVAGDAVGGGALYDRLDANLQLGLAATVRRALAERRDPSPAVAGLAAADLRHAPPNHGALLLDLVAEEVARWSRGEPFNSRVWAYRRKLSPVAYARPALQLFRHRVPSFLENDDHPPVVVLDATGDAELYQRVLGRPVEEYRVEVRAPEHVRLWLVQDAVSVGKWALAYNANNRASLIAKAKYMLSLPEIKGDGTRRVALITHKKLADELAHALGVADVFHFGALRGTNALAGYEVLLVISHNQEAPDELLRRASGLHWGEPPIDPTCANTRGVHDYADPPVQRLVEQTRERELDQAVYRGRPFTTERPQDIVVFSPLVPALTPGQPIRVVTQFPLLGATRRPARRAGGR